MKPNEGSPKNLWKLSAFNDHAFEVCLLGGCRAGSHGTAIAVRWGENGWIPKAKHHLDGHKTQRKWWDFNYQPQLVSLPDFERTINSMSWLFAAMIWLFLNLEESKLFARNHEGYRHLWFYWCQGDSIIENLEWWNEFIKKVIKLLSSHFVGSFKMFGNFTSTWIKRNDFWPSFSVRRMLAGMELRCQAARDIDSLWWCWCLRSRSHLGFLAIVQLHTGSIPSAGP